MKKYRQNRFLVLGFVLFLIYIFISSSLHFHSDAKYHQDCPLCQYSKVLHSMQTECAFTLYNNFEFLIKINQNIFKIPFLLSTRDYVIRPPPFFV